MAGAQNDSVLNIKLETYRELAFRKYGLVKERQFSAVALLNAPDNSLVGMYYNEKNGTFYSALEGNRLVNYGLQTNGLRKYKRFKFAGYFRFDKTQEYNRQIGIFSDKDFVYPVLLTDTIGGDWNKGEYRLGFQGVYEDVFNVLDPVIGLDYTVSHAGKNRDPRPKHLGNDIRFNAGLNIDFNENNQLYIGGKAGFYKEDIDVLNLYGNGSNTIFKIAGLTIVSLPQVFSAMKYRYQSEFVGGELTYVYHRGNVVLTNNISYYEGVTEAIESPYNSMLDEEVNEVISLAEIDGEVLTQDVDLVSHLWWRKRNINFIHLDINRKNNRFYNPFQDGLIHKKQVFQLMLLYGLEKDCSFQKKWYATIGADYKNEDDQAYLAGEQMISSLIFKTSFKKNFSLMNRFILAPEIRLNYKYVPNSYLNLQTEGPFVFTSSFINNTLFIPRFEYLSEDYFSSLLALNVYTKTTGEKNFCTRLQYSYLRGVGSQLDVNSFRVSIKMLF